MMCYGQPGTYNSNTYSQGRLLPVSYMEHGRDVQYDYDEYLDEYPLETRGYMPVYALF